MPQKISKETSLECLVTIVLDGSYLLEDHFETIFEAYLEPILKHMKQPILIEQEDKEKKEVQKEKITPKLKCGLVVFGNYEPRSRSPVTKYYFEESISQFEKIITSIEFEDGGMRENAVAEGLVAALEMLDAYKGRMKSETLEPRKHFLLISNSHPCPDLVHRNIDEKYDQFSLKQIVEEMKKQNIHLSLITPERNFTKLEELVTEVNQDVEVHNATDEVNPSYVVKLAGFKPLFNPKEVPIAQKRKREDSTSSIGTQILSTQSSVNDAKKVKLEQEPVKEQSPALKSMQQTHPLQNSSLIKDQTATTQNPSVQQQPSIQSPVADTTTPAQVITPKLQTPAVTTSISSNTNTIPNSFTQIQQPVKTTNQTIPNNVAIQPSATSTTPISQPPQHSVLVPQQSMPGSFSARPQQGITGINKYPIMPSLHAQLQRKLSQMSPDQQRQFLADLKSPRNSVLFRNTLAANNAQQHLLRQNTMLQHELAASQQNLANVFRRSVLQLQNGAQVNVGNGGNFITSTAPINETVSSQSLNGLDTSSISATQQLGAFNASTAPVSNPVGFTTASTSISAANAQFGGQIPTSSIGTMNAATNSVQLPASTMMNPTSTTGMNNNVIGQTVNVSAGVVGQVSTSINGVQNRPPAFSQKTHVNPLWSGQISWSSNHPQTKQKRESTCRVTAFPISQKKPTSTSQLDYMVSCWPEKMEISGVNNLKDVISNASLNLKVIFLATPAQTSAQISTQENSNIFASLVRTLDSKKMAAFVRFPSAPNPNGGIVLYSNGQKIAGLLFLDTPLPANLTVSPQAQQFRPPQQSQQTLQLQMQQQFMIQQQIAAMRAQQQQQQQQQQQPTMQIPAATAQVLQQNALQQLQQQQQIAMLQQQTMAGLPTLTQQMLQQRQVMQPNMLQTLGNDQLLQRRRMVLQTANNASPEQMIEMMRRQSSQQQPTQ